MKKNKFIQKIKKICQILTQVTNGRWIFVFISAILPFFIMSLFGIILAIKYDHGLSLSLAIAFTLFPIAIPLYFFSHKEKITLNVNNMAKENTSLLSPSLEWSDEENKIWKDAQIYIQLHINQVLKWEDIDTCALKLLEKVAENYNKTSLEFTLPEALSLFEEISARYKKALIEHIPGCEFIKMSHLKKGMDFYTQYGDITGKVISAAMLANNLKNLYLNPLKAAIDITKQQTSSTMSKDFFACIEYKAKQILLEEVVTVAIELYSGRFIINTSNISINYIDEKDKKRKAPPLSPLRLVLVGQVNAGKSSLVNLLKNEFCAEVDALPSTENTLSYTFTYQDQNINLIDIKGLNGDNHSQNNQLQEMQHADLIIWLLKANQPARDLDIKLLHAFTQYYSDPKNISRKKPRIIAVLNHIDKLLPEIEYLSLFDLKKSKTKNKKRIKEAMAHNKSLLKPNIIMPLSIAENKPHFGFEAIKEHLMHEINKARNVQLNRHGNEKIKQNKSAKNNINQVINACKKTIPNVFKAIPSLFFDSKKNKLK